ncbi:MAG: beta strand repeat-containing protein [Gemmatimonadaceae bacterium]
MKVYRSVPHLSRIAVVLGAIACSATEGTNNEPPPSATDRLSVTVTPERDSILLGTAKLFTASVTNQFKQPRAAQVLWSSSNEAVLTVGRDGFVTAIGDGSAQIVASIPGHADTALVSVYGAPITLQVIPEVLSLALGDDFQITADAGGASAGAGQSIEWSVSDSTIARISPDGVVSGVDTGEVIITARLGTATAEAGVGVFALPVASVTVAPAAITVQAGDTFYVEAIPRTSAGKYVKGMTATWSSSNPAVARVKQGAITGVARGFATIPATISGKTGSATVNVTAPAVASVRATMPDSSVLVGQSIQATALALDANGNTIAGLPVGWQASNPAIATVTNGGMVKGIVPGSVTISAIIGGKVGSIPATVGGQTATSVVIIPANPTLVAGGTAQLVGEVRDQNGQKIPGQSISWSSANPGVASVSPSGLLSGISAGSATITATAGALSATATAVINQIPVASVIVSPSSAQLTSGDTITLVATPRDAQGASLAGRVVTWTSSSAQIATVGSTGEVSAQSPGTVTITATSEGKTASAAITVKPVAPVVSSVSVTLNSTLLNVAQTTQAVAVPRDNAGNAITGQTITWSSSDNSVATVSSTGLVTAVNGGSVSIEATVSGVLGGAALTVNAAPPAPVATVSISLSPTTVGAGQQSQATVVLRDAAGNVLTGRTIGFSSSNPSVATVSAGGLVAGVANGTASITATSGGISGAATITVSGGAPVVTSVTVTAPVTTLSVNDTTRAVATALDQSGNPISGMVTYWASSNAAIAKVGAGGKVTALSAGSATVTATAGGVSGSLGFVVTGAQAAACANVALTLNSSTLTAGQTTQSTVVLTDALGNVLTGRTVTYSSSNTSVATVASSGLVTAVAAGSAVISANCSGAIGTASVTVQAGSAPVASVTLTLTPASVWVGQTALAAAVLKDASGNILVGRPITWAITSGSSVASVSQVGLVTGLATGSATVTATSGTVSGSATLTVTAAPTGIATPELPRSVPVLPASILGQACTSRPTTATALQAAINAHEKVICLSMGLSLTGNWDVPARPATDAGWSVLRADSTFTLGQRITGTERLPKLTISDVRFPALMFHSKAARWFVQGIELTTNSAITAGPMALVEVGERISERTLADLPKDIHFAHMNLHGWLNQNLRRGWVLNGASHIVRDSRCTEIHERNSDSQCTLSYNGPGPFLIENNLLEAASENIMWGGGDPAIPGLVPCDITVRGNLIRKPVAWKAIGTPTQSGSYNVKLLYESKSSCRSLVELNKMDGVWQDGQTGYAIWLKSVNQNGNCRWCRTVDVTIRNNTLTNIGSGFAFSGSPEKFPVDTGLSRVMVSGNWIENINLNPFTGDARPVLLNSKGKDISFVRNTWTGGNLTRDAIILDISGSWPAVTGFRFDNNVIPTAVYGLGATGVGEGTKALNAAVAGTWSFSGNTFVGALRNGYPLTTQFAPNLNAAFATGAGVSQPPVP